MAITKKATKQYTRVTATSIMHAEQTLDGTYRVAFMGRDKNSPGVTTRSLPCTPEMYNTIMTGMGHSHPNLKIGLHNAHLYNFALLTEKKEGAAEATVVGLHSFPTPSFYSSAMELSLPGEGVHLGLAGDEAVIHLIPSTGEMDIHVMPEKFVPAMVKLVGALEEKEELKEMDQFVFGNIRCTIDRFIGNDIIIRCEDMTHYGQIVR